MLEADLIVSHLPEGIEPTSQWSDDFQQILFDLLAEHLGYTELPETLPVKSVPSDLYLNQALEMEYTPGDERIRPEYQRELTDYTRGGGKLPPLIVAGDKLLDYRHRIIAMSGTPTVRVIDMNGLRHK